MADNNLFVGKWLPADAVIDPSVDIQQQILQFYKDGSCLIPSILLGKESAEYPMFFFYQVFENGMMRVDSGEPVLNLYHCAMVGENLTLTAMNGEAFTFIKVKEERRSFFRSRVAEAAPAADAAAPEEGAEAAPAPKREPEPEREPEEHEWKCPTCGKINQNYVGTCGCGAAKPNNKLFNWAEVHPDLVKKPEPEEPVIEIEEPKEEKSKKPVLPEREPLEHEWKCPNCGKINQNYVGTCGCGAPKPNDKLFNWAEVHPDLVKKPEPEEPVIIDEPKKAKKEKVVEPEPEKEPGENEWKCPGCGKINQNYVGTCGCGERKPAHIGPYIPPKEVLERMKPEETIKVETAPAAEAAPAPEATEEK